MYANWYARLHEENRWVDERGVEHAISRMSPRYARNLLVWIERQHEGIVQAAANALRDVELPPPDTHAYDDVMRSCNDEATAMAADPLAWLAQTPLVQALTDAATPYIARHRQPKRHLHKVPLTDRHLHSV